MFRRPRFETLESRDLLSVVAGAVFSDLNSSGTRDAGEPGLAGWSVWLDQSADGVAGDVGARRPTPVLNLACPGERTTVSAFAVSGVVGAISDINLSFSLVDAANSSQEIRLVSPAGTSVLVSAGGVQGTGFAGVTFDDEAIAMLPRTYTTGTLSGLYVPSNSLSAFDGEDPNGTWHLIDRSGSTGAGNGTLVDWSLTITTPEPATTTDVEGNYWFDVPAGSYSIRVAPQADWVRTAPVAPLHSVAVSAGQEVNNLDFAEHYVQPSQVIGRSGDSLPLYAGTTVEFPITYSTSNGDSAVTGLGLRVHYNSAILADCTVTPAAANLVEVTPSQADVDNLDGDASTDRYVVVAWADTTNSQWPGGELPATIATASFTVAATATTDTAVRFTAASAAAGYAFQAHDMALQLATATLDVDGNGSADALTDGILILRYLFDPDGEWSYSDATGAGATRTSQAAIRGYLDQAVPTVLDVDGNGTADALSDGILAIRYLFGGGTNLNYADALGEGATRDSRPTLQAFLGASLGE